MHDELIQALLDPARYPHPASEIEVRETHISWVLLTGEFAYKIKKPVKLPFLDFSTLDRRKHYCQEELRLNRRFAPELYVAVVPITGSRTAPTVDGEGAPVEYAVKLKQFSSDNELSTLVAANRIDCEDLARFGHVLARLHKDALRVSTARAEDAPRTVDLNLRELSAVLPKQRKRIEALGQQLGTLQLRIGPLLAARYAGDSMRECHGDLHMGNVVRVNDVLTPFDCIEFDTSLRNIDVLNDGAFLFMDLQAHDRRDLSYCFLNAWLEDIGHYDALPLLPYYVAHRALVRAKVAAHQSPDSPSVERYLSEAERQLRTQAPRLLITCGLSGSGKTWLSKQLARELPAIHIRSDVERKRLAGLDALESSRSSADGGIYTLEFNVKTYARLLDCSRAALQASQTVIADAAFLRRNERKMFAELASELNIPFAILHCVAPDQTLRERIESRKREKRDASEATVEVLAKQHEYWESFTSEETSSVIDVNTGAVSVASLADKIANQC